MSLNPVALPPGRDRLSTSPMATGLPTLMNTMGIVDVCRFAATDAVERSCGLFGNARWRGTAAGTWSDNGFCRGLALWRTEGHKAHRTADPPVDIGVFSSTPH